MCFNRFHSNDRIFLIMKFLFLPFTFLDHQMLENVIKYTKIKREKPRRNKDQVYVNGYRFVIASQSESTIYLKCANFRNKCNARASKRKDTGETFVTKSQHTMCCVCLIDTDGIPMEGASTI